MLDTIFLGIIATKLVVDFYFDYIKKEDLLRFYKIEPKIVPIIPFFEPKVEPEFKCPEADSYDFMKPSVSTLVPIDYIKKEDLPKVRKVEIRRVDNNSLINTLPIDHHDVLVAEKDKNLKVILV